LEIAEIAGEKEKKRGENAERKDGEDRLSQNVVRLEERFPKS
jgi:hypothetical protein